MGFDHDRWHVLRWSLPAGGRRAGGAPRRQRWQFERDGSFLYGGPNGAEAAAPDAQKQVYRIDLASGTNLETIAASGDVEQDAELGLTLSGKTLEEVVLEQGWSALASAGTVGSSMIVVDALDEGAAAFYAGHGFVRLPDSLRLVLPMRMLARLMAGS